MKLRSNDFQHAEMIPARFSCDDENISPQLAWDGVKAKTKSLTLIMDDPDAPLGLWRHWLVCDIPPDVKDVEEGKVPAGGREIENDFGRKEYGGPCPPSGTHRYFFKLYALNVESVGTVNKRSLYAAVDIHKLDEALFMGTYRHR